MQGLGNLDTSPALRVEVGGWILPRAADPQLAVSARWKKFSREVAPGALASAGFLRLGFTWLNSGYHRTKNRGIGKDR